MKRLTLALAGYFLLTGLYLLIAPKHFYLNTPGVAQMGPFNLHFIIDVALVFIASACAIFWGALRNIRSTALAGAAWPGLHALFHLQIWGHRNFVVDHITIADFTAVILPGLLALFLAGRVRGQAS